MSNVLKALAALAAAATLALAPGAAVGSGAINPCPGNYDLVSYAPEDQSPDFIEADTNGNFKVCVYQGSSARAEPVRDDRLPKN